jgi:phosphomannomutase
MELIRSISGIRGIVGKTLTGEDVGKYAQAFSLIQGGGSILLARDSRYHGRELLSHAKSALVNAGRDVVDCDIIPTPTAQFQVQHQNFAGGIVITASHNPMEWNGLKFIDGDGCFLGAEVNQQLFDTADSLSPQPIIKNLSDKISQLAAEDHLNHTVNLSTIDTERIKNRNFKVVLDAVNGAGSYILPELLSSFNCELVSIYCSPDGTFPRGSEPLPVNLVDLGNAVKEHGADVGFAVDPDGDRLAVVDENGKPLGEEYTLTICAEGFLAESGNKQPLVTNLSTTMALDKVAEKYGVEVKRSSVGEINVVNLMKKTGSVLGGEGNGGVILKESHYGRDSLVGIAMFLNKMSQVDIPVSRIFSSMPQFVMAKDKMDLGEVNADRVIKKIASIFSDVDQDWQDGLKLIWENQWVHIRKSNTEPILRIYAEAENSDLLKRLMSSIKETVST